MLSINRVTGDSMSPVIPTNSYVIFHRFFNKKSLNVGDLVKVKHPKYGLIIKTIAFIDRNDFYWLAGENLNSVSTLDMGLIQYSMIVGKTWRIITP